MTHPVPSAPPLPLMPYQHMVDPLVPAVHSPFPSCTLSPFV
eukprot:gene12001-8269_t